MLFTQQHEEKPKPPPKEKCERMLTLSDIVSYSLIQEGFIEKEAMKRYLATIIIFSLLGCFVSGVFSDPGLSWEEQTTSAQIDTGKDLGVEYDKLLQMLKEKRAPVQSLDGALDISGRPGVGPKDSDVILVEFGDFQCLYCRRHLEGTAQMIHERLVLTNQLRYVFLDYPMEEKHPLATKAAAAARCAEEQGKYWEMRNILYNNQKALHELFLAGHAKAAGLDEVAFNVCLQSGRYDTAIQQDQLVGRSLGIKGTPTFLLGTNNGNKIHLIRKILGVQPYEIFEREIRDVVDIANNQEKEEAQISRTGF